VKAPAAISAPILKKAPSPSASTLVGPAPTDAAVHLKSALEELIKRNKDIDEQLSRVRTLELEKETITKQIDAIHTALQVFGVSPPK
jgi:hypothetical protein